MTHPVNHPVRLGGIHHAAYRCKDAKETVEWYARVLGMTYTTAFAEDHVPSTGEYDPYMHIFLDAGNGNILAFFELPNQPEMGRDANTPQWVQHLALKIPDEASLLAAKAHIEAQGIDVLAVRIGAVMVGSALMALGGAFLTLAAFDSFFFTMIQGRGWVCIALVVFASWKPGKALLGALLYGLFDAYQLRLQHVAPEGVPYQLFLMMPYLLSILALIVMSRRAAYPRALMQPYRRGDR